MMGLMFVIFSIAAIVLVLYALFCLVFVAIVAYRIAHPKWHRPRPGHALSNRYIPVSWQDATHPKDLSLPFRDVSFSTAEQITLRGWLIPCDTPSIAHNASRAAVVCVHGAGRDRRAFLRHAAYLRAAGYDVLLFDCVNHGASDKAPTHPVSRIWSHQAVTLGRREYNDVAAAITFARQRGARTVVVMATSQGAAAALVAQVANDDQPAADALILENPFESPNALISNVVHSICDTLPIALPRALLVVPITWLTLFFTGHLFHACSQRNAIDCIASVQVPIMIIHGMDDVIVHFSQSQRLFDAIRHDRKSLWFVQSAHHTQCFHAQPDAFQRKTLDFLKSHIS